MTNLALTTDAGVTIIGSILTSNDTVTRYHLDRSAAERVAELVAEYRHEGDIHEGITYVTADPTHRRALKSALAFAASEANRQIAALLDTAADAGLVR